MNQTQTLVNRQLITWLQANTATTEADGKLRNAVNALNVAVQARMAIAASMARAEAREDFEAADSDLITLIAQDREVNQARHEVQARIDIRNRKRQLEHNAYVCFNEAYDRYLALDNDEIDP